jgi:flavodoxin
MKNILLIVIGLLIIGAGVVFALQNNGKENPVKSENTLVAYFSATGTTKRVAENLAKATGADIYGIKPLKPYTSADLNWHDSNSRSSVEMNDPKSRPELVSDNFSIDNYDTIYLGFPIWWGTAPKVVHTFLEKYDFSGKKVIIFATSGSSGLGDTANNLKSSVSTSTKIVEGKVLNGNPSVNELKQWVEGLK